MEEGELMFQGTCVNTENSVILTEGENYYLFPNGPNHYYVSKFPNDNAHTGCFESKYFQLFDQEEPYLPEIDRDKVYLAHMYRKERYPGLELKEYFIKPRKTHCNIYEDKNLKQFKGCFPLAWFTDFEEIAPETANSDHIVEVIKFREAENGQLLLFL